MKGFTIETGVAQCLHQTYGTDFVFGYQAGDSILPVQSLDSFPIGPYVASVSNGAITLGTAYRVHQDENMAFMNGLLPSGNDGTYRYSPANTHSDSTIGVPVPSRLYSNGSKDDGAPLKGVRVSVKDIIDIKGVKTSQGNRAWYKLYDAKNESAPGVRKLINLGAEIVGKTKTAQFANSDRPTADWVDYQYA